MKTRGVAGVVAAWAIVSGCGGWRAQVVEPTSPSEAVAIWVNGAGITRNDIQWETARLMAVAPEPATTNEAQSWGRYYQMAVDNLVVRQLIRMEMARAPVEISEEEMEQAKKEIEASVGGRRSIGALADSSMASFDAMEESIRMDIYKNRQLEAQIALALEGVDEDEARRYYETHPEEFRMPAGRTASHILIRHPGGSDPEAGEQARERAEGIRRQLQEGADFQALALEHSACLSRIRGGDLGYIRPGLEDPAFERAVYGQAVGEVGPVVQTKVGFHIVKATGEQEEQEIPFGQAKGWILARMKAEVRRSLASAYIRSLREKATIQLAGDLESAIETSHEARR